MADPTEVSASTPSFDQILGRLPDEVAAGRSVCILFDGGSAEAQQQALARIKEATGLPLHQIRLDTLYDERAEVTQGNLREVFDSMGEAPSILCLENADAFFRSDRRQAAREGLDPDARTPLTYLFDRMAAFGGIVVLCLSSAAYLQEARPHAHLVVTF